MKKIKKRRKKNRAKGIFLILLLLIATTASFFYFYLLSFSEGKSEKSPPVISKSGDPVNILIMGVDIGGIESDNEPKRTDTIILMNYNPKNKKINIVSIPRDTRVVINNNWQKINNAHAIDGVNGLINSVENLLKVNINYYAKLNFKGFRSLVDSVGGIDMEIAQNMYYDDASQNLHINFKKGEKVHLDGKKAEEFFRWRKNNDGTGLAEGDLGRIKNQHLFIEKFIAKVKSPSTIARLPIMLSTLPKYVETNMEPNDMVKYAYNFLRVEKSDMQIRTLKGEAKYIGKISYFIYDENGNRDIISIFRGGTSESSYNINEEDIKVEILNGTNVNGLAATIGKKMKAKGFSNVSVGNTNQSKESKIIASGLDKKTLKSISKELGIKNVENSSLRDRGRFVKVIIGEDFKK
ncbi:transcriptional regulator [Clostridium tetani]|uniref:LCP family protein n=1 Tax=Clostridium tetani TaxID=1513 RepID=UPI0005141230|nr:LCP family protein [Clostridium tetani]AVP55039.1 LytR family transcriptional regulator [Clostridium tetani]KGI44725.1 transcriptional regulator [Clostridium tetani]RXI53306.1 LytR family transcriptional regulator [Clostridium tetani]RXI54750.1 LytR family transcriptional regulator [Clostridium tetani]RXI73790.1 LytR family transcriptional regulator [Clostridium tetani]